MNGKLKVGVIGVGFGARVQIPVFQDHPDTEVLAVCSARLPRVKEVASRFNIPYAFTDYRELVQLPELDVVSIITPPPLHYPMALAALDAGKHVLCDKPFALDVHEARIMADKVRATGLVGMTDFEMRFSPGHIRAWELLREQFIGEPQLVNVSMLRRWRGENQERMHYDWQHQDAMGGGALGAAGSHLIDMVRFLLGEFTGVVGRLHTLVKERPDQAGTTQICDADDTFNASFVLGNGMPGNLLGSLEAFAGSGTRIEIFGSEGTLVIPTLNYARPPYLLGAVEGESNIHPLPIPDRLGPFLEYPGDIQVMIPPFTGLVDRLTKAIRGQAEASPSFEDGLRCQEVMDAIRLSHREARWVSLPFEAELG